ncbi:TPA: transposase family protein [Candidatus Woesearchaeota archaeon]|nr:transposase family protein [Candidatus Woesearchaeota archaeon]
MKLTRAKLVETLRVLNDGESKYQARKIGGITKQRVYQVWNIYNQTGEIPAIGKDVGRPSKPVEDWEVSLVRVAWVKYGVSADTLERFIERDYGKRIGHNWIHKIMLTLGFAKRKAKKDVRKKAWVRYERRHSLTAVHIDWHYDGKTYVFAVIDDASRKILALLECGSATTDASIQGMEEALKHGSIKQCISDHSAQFVANITDGNSRFKAFLESRGIRQILCRIKHPQGNGKVER